MQLPQNLSKSDQHWFDLIQQCRTSGKSDYQWLQENNISSGTFYYHVKQLRNKACELPVSAGKSKIKENQEVVPLIIDELKTVTTPLPQKTVSESIAVRLNIQGIAVEISNSATQDVIKNTLTALQYLC